ncbi:MAG: hypothetical protein M3Q34_04160 [bacterium]|nr:hypothetical protein [bacterium]
MISTSIQGIIIGLEKHKENDIYGEDKGPIIDVNRITGQVSTFYEKIRYTVDYKEQHTIRRSAVERILKRKVLMERVPNAGLSLLEELVASGYLLNKSIPEGIADDINKIVSKYLDFASLTGVQLNRILSLMATEIERFLYPQVLNDLIIESFYDNVFKNIKYQGTLSEQELSHQMFLSCRRSLLEEDYDTTFYALLIRSIPELTALQTKEEIKAFASKFSQAVYKVELQLEDPLGWSMTARLKNYSVYFSVIKEIFKKHGVESEAFFRDQDHLKREIESLLSREYTSQFELIDKSGKRAVVYILLTKVILAFAVELPFEKFVLNEINYLALTTNVIFHPLLLLGMVKSVPPIYSNNTSNVVLGVTEIIEGKNTRPIYIKPRTDSNFLKTAFDYVYIVLFVISFGLIMWILNALHFNIVSILLFLFFLTLVSYFGFRIHHNAKKWRLEVENDNFFSLLWSFFTIPIVRTGRWLSKRFSTVNIFVFLMDFIIETPFKLILGTFNSFILFIKDKREDPY